MAAEDFTFKSPGIFIREIDRSTVPQTPQDVGPVVIGCTSRGPALFPTVVENLDDFRKTFGDPIPGLDSKPDVWRNGSSYATTYGAYAATSYLQAKERGPLTFVRLLGDNDPSKEEAEGDAGAAGWEASKAYGIFLFGTSSATVLTGALAGVIYTTNAATTVQVTDNSLSGVGSLVATTGSTVKLTITPSVGDAEVFDVVFDDETAGAFARNFLNTNPEKTNGAIFSETKEYWLGETYEDFVSDTTNLPNTKFAAVYEIISGSLVSQAQRLVSLKEPKTPWIISQDLSADATLYDIENVDKLFRLAGIQQSGIQLQRDIKVAVENINFSTVSGSNPFGTFDLVVYNTRAIPGEADAGDDALVRYSNLTLDKTSQNYIARRIGDTYYTWNATEERYNERGEFLNTNPYFRVELHEDFVAGNVPDAALPFGYLGGVKYKDQTFTSGTVSGLDTTLSASLAGIASGFENNTTAIDGTTFATNPGTYNGFDFTGEYSGSIVFPTIETKNTVTYNAAGAYFGVASARNNESYNDLTRRLSSDLTTQYVPTSGEPVEFSLKFTLDDVQQGTGSTADTSLSSRTYATDYRKATYAPGSRAAESSITSTGGWATGSAATESLYSGSYKSVLRKRAVQGPELNRFVVPFFGGADGIKITEPAPFANRLLDGTTTLTSYANYSINKAIKTVKDPEALQYDSIAIPGLTNNSLQNSLIDVVEERGDAIALLDINHDYLPNTETAAANTITDPSLKSALITMQNRQLNSNYAAAYYPSVRVTTAGGPRVMPPTVAMMGVFGLTAGRSQPWFAPAGFNRGGLDQVGVNGVTLTLRSRERDDLYENNVNPIANFPAEGAVVFGQKTLQQIASARDRINVRRLLIYLKRQVDHVARSVLFEGNTTATRRSFSNQISTILERVKSQGGVTEYRILIGPDATTVPQFNDLTDRNALYGKVLIKPTRSIEFIALDFEILRTGAELG